MNNLWHHHHQVWRTQRIVIELCVPRYKAKFVLNLVENRALLLWGHLLLLIYLFVCVCFFLCVIGAFIVGTYCCTARAWDNISATMAYVIWRNVSVLQRIPISGFFQFFLSLFVPPFVCLLPYLFVCRIVYRLVGFIEGLTCFVE